MKFNIKIIFVLALIFIITYKVIVAMDNKGSEDSVNNKVKENFSVTIPDKTEDIGYIGTSKMSISSNGMFDNSCMMLH